MPSESTSTGRLEAFSDGVIAVIITIMVLELKVPHENGLAGLRVVLPILLVYALSFAFTGIYWINHHHLVHRLQETTHNILYANLGFLFSLSLIPYFTSYVIEKEINPFSVILYSASMIATGFTFFLLRLCIDARLREGGKLEERNTAEQRKHIVSLGIYLAAVPLALFHPRLSLSLFALVSVMWIIPSASVKPVVNATLAPRPRRSSDLDPNSSQPSGTLQ